MKKNTYTDYGWRLNGQKVDTLKECSFTMFSSDQPKVQEILEPYYIDPQPLVSCFQCGVCTATCNLSENSGALPRRQISFVQLGQKERLLKDPDIWHCYNCTDCSLQCPMQGKPSRIIAALRQMAVEHYVFPAVACRLFNSIKGMGVIFVLSAILLFLAVGFGGSFSPERNPVRFASMLPNLFLNIFFFLFFGLAALSVIISMSRIWYAFTNEPFYRLRLRDFNSAFSETVREILTHRKFSECRQFPLSRFAHMSIFYGFMLLAVISGIVGILLLFNILPYPFAILHPLKISDNIAGALLIFGCSYFVINRYSLSKSGDKSTWYDWALILNLLIIGASGFLAEIFRYADIAAIAYPVYFIHLVFVLVMFVTLPQSKLAHAAYRTVAILAGKYQAAKHRPVMESLWPYQKK